MQTNAHSVNTTPAIELPKKSLINRYNIQSPRYTSYPTANEMHAIDEAYYLHALQSVRDKPFEPLSLYVHIPFCFNICYYCGCNKIVTKDTNQASLYLQYLDKEMALVQGEIGKRRIIKQLHIGGGTPTFLDAGQLTFMMLSIAKHFRLSDDENREFSIEVDPRTVNPDTLALLKGLGFNRISFGVQDLDPQVQKCINREHSLDDIQTLVSSARELGFESINLDFLYGLPLQTEHTFSQTLDHIVTIKPDRIALYNYAHMPSIFKSQRALDRLKIPTPENKIQLYHTAIRKLTESGYKMIGMDHFVLTSDELYQAQRHRKLQRNFQGYSVKKANDLIGIGVSAISQNHRAIYQNAKDINDYYQAIDDKQFAYKKGLSISDEDIRCRAVIMSLMTCFRIDIKEWEATFKLRFLEYFKQSIDALESYRLDGLVDITDTHVNITAKGYLFVRQITRQFDRYKKNNTDTFSKAL